MSVRKRDVGRVVAQAHPKRRLNLGITLESLQGDGAYRRYRDAHLWGLRPSSRRGCEAALLDLFRFVGGRPLAGLSSGDLEAWHGCLCGVVAGGTVVTYVRRVKTFYRFCEQAGICENPTRILKYPEYEVRAPRPEDLPTREDLLRLKGVVGNPRDEALVLTLFESGARSGELRSMRVRDVEWVEGGAALYLRESKTFSRRVFVSMCAPSLQVWLQHHPWRHRPDAPLWPVLEGPLRGSALTKSGLGHMLYKWYRLAGLGKPARAQLFRKARVSELARVMTDAQLESYFGWKPGRGAQMRAIYSRTFDWQDQVASIKALEG